MQVVMISPSYPKAAFPFVARLDRWRCQFVGCATHFLVFVVNKIAGRRNRSEFEFLRPAIIQTTETEK